LHKVKFIRLIERVSLLLIFPEHSQSSEERVHDNIHPSPTIDTSILKNRMKHVRIYYRDAFICCQSARCCRYILPRR